MIRRFLLPTMALTGLLFVLLSPQTGWLARQQLKMAWLNQGEAEIKRLTTPPTPVATTPAMEAAWKLNTLCTGKYTWRRADLERLVSTSVSEEQEPLKYASYEEVLRLCAIGEQYNPQNSFFTLLRGAALLASHKDAAALKELHIAAQKNYFEGYDAAALNGMYQQLRAHKAQGLTEVTLPLYLASGTKRMWGGNLRFFFRGIMAYALKRQMEGDLKGSIALRQDLRRIYDLQLQRDIFPLPCYVEIAQLSPLPLPLIGTDVKSSPIKEMQLPVWMGPILSTKQRLINYPIFLRENGYTQEAYAFEKGLALNKAKSEERKARQEQIGDIWSVMGYVHQMSLQAWWGLLLLTSVITSLSCGVLARALYFTQSNDVYKKGRIGALLVFWVLVLLIGSAWHGSMDDAVMAWVERVVQPCYSAGGDSEPKPWYSDLLWSLNRWGSNAIVILIALAPVLLAQFIGGIWALVKRRPLGQGVLGGVWKASIPVAAITLLIWCGGVMWLAKEEARQLARFSQVLQSGY
ncbi:MAG: hypothetical protein QM758_02350 [Armatimonas sp.]